MQYKRAFKYLERRRDRHGNLQVYVRMPGRPRVRIREAEGTPEFIDAYRLALAAGGAAPSEKSLEWLCKQYFASATFRELGDATRPTKRAILEEICGVPVGKHHFGLAPYRTLTPGDVRKLRDMKAHLPAAANARVKELKALFNWAIRAELSRYNPATKIEKIGGKSEGFYTWTERDVEAFEAHWPLGSKQRLAMAIMLYLGVRRSDAIRIGNGHVSGAFVKFWQFKNRERSPKELILPIVAQLREALDASELGADTWLVADDGEPYTETNFFARFKKWCVAAGMY